MTAPTLLRLALGMDPNHYYSQHYLAAKGRRMTITDVTVKDPVNLRQMVRQQWNYRHIPSVRSRLKSLISYLRMMSKTS